MRFVRAVQPPRVKIHPSRISNDQSKIKPKVQQPRSTTFIHPKFMNLSQQQSSASALTIPMLTGPYKDRAIHIRRPKTIQMPNKTKGLSLDQRFNVREHQHVLLATRVFVAARHRHEPIENQNFFQLQGQHIAQTESSNIH
ncbi:hypothetical protein Nepgr_026649 [Nepenthes gracilis]|uniref:Uncharacterized protein n=1 Tax=Nepenthes gracilis TaxID=150966 RepID=A0AAD3T8X5_NEPGR|nr:hypothetical protein Nepgr_026649 [Nepenthes gracilis]